MQSDGFSSQCHRVGCSPLEVRYLHTLNGPRSSGGPIFLSQAAAGRAVGDVSLSAHRATCPGCKLRMDACLPLVPGLTRDRTANHLVAPSRSETGELGCAAALPNKLALTNARLRCASGPSDPLPSQRPTALDFNDNAHAPCRAGRRVLRRLSRRSMLLCVWVFIRRASLP
jgi:hypothetical protein